MRTGSRLFPWLKLCAALCAGFLCVHLLLADPPLPSSAGVGTKLVPGGPQPDVRGRPQPGQPFPLPPSVVGGGQPLRGPAEAGRPARGYAGLAVVPVRNTPGPEPPPLVPNGADEETIRKLPTPVPSEEPPGDAPDAERAILLGAARNAARQGNYEAAVARYEQYLARFGDVPAVRQEYAGLLITANELGKAAEQFRQLLARQPDSLELHFALADVYVAAKEYRPAGALLLRALEKSPGNLEVAARLARTYAFDDNLPRALAVYDRYLARLRPGDEAVPRALGALLLDLGKPEDALPFVLALRETRPDDLEIAADLVRCYARLGERQKAAEALQALAAAGPRALPVRLALADTLYQSGDYEVAGLAYAQVLQADPGNGFALVGTARVHLQTFDPQQARQVLEGLTPKAPVRRAYLLTWAEYHQLVGEYVEAKQVYADLLCRDAADYEARLALAALHEYVREYEKAKAEYAKVPADATAGRKARLGFAATLAAQRHFPEAVEACKALLAENPGDGDATALLARALAKQDLFDQAESVGRSFLRNNPGNEPASLTVRLALGRLLLDAGRYQAAAREYELVLARPANRLPVAYYGLARAAEKLGHRDKAGQVLMTILSLVGGDARSRLLLADLYAGDGEDAKVVEMCQAVLKWDPQNLAALIRLADAQQRIARFTAQIKEPVRTCRSILALSESNVRAFLALARSRSAAQDYQAAAAEYDRLIALDPEFTVPRREKARVLFSDHQFDASAAAYQQLLTPSADDKLQAALAAYALRESRARPALERYAQAGLPGPVLRAEVAKLAGSCADPQAEAGLRHLLYDYEAHAAEQAGARLEAEAKSKKGLRNYQAVPVYQALVAAEPGNEEALFDLGQVYGTLRQTRNELPQYGQVLKVEPQHRESMVTLERAGLELQPQLRLGIDFFSQNGRGGLARIDRTRYLTFLTWPYGDENEYFGLGFGRASYNPPDDRTLDGNILSARLQKKFCDRLLLYSQVNYEDYESRLRDRPTFDAGAQLDVCDLGHARVGAFLENVVENGETLRQDLYRTGLYAGADVRATRKWDLGGSYRLAYYSDVNYLNEFYLYSGLLLTHPPKELKLVLDLDYQAFARQTVLNGKGPNPLVGAVHPYFSPGSFAFYEARLEWTHWLSRDYFVHSNQCYYSLQYAVGWDSRLINYHSIRALANFDLKPWLSVGADAKQTLSSVYNVTSVTGYLLIRFPCGLCNPCKLWRGDSCSCQ